MFVCEKKKVCVSLHSSEIVTKLIVLYTTTAHGKTHACGGQKKNLCCVWVCCCVLGVCVSFVCALVALCDKY